MARKKTTEDDFYELLDSMDCMFVLTLFLMVLAGIGFLELVTCFATTFGPKHMFSVLCILIALGVCFTR